MTREIPIENKNLWESRGNIPLRSFLKAAEKLGLRITQPNSGSSHYAIRKPDVLANGLESFITNVYEGMNKQAKGDIIKRLLKYCIEEKELWKSLER